MSWVHINWSNSTYLWTPVFTICRIKKNQPCFLRFENHRMVVHSIRNCRACGIIAERCNSLLKISVLCHYILQLFWVTSFIVWNKAHRWPRRISSWISFAIRLHSQLPTLLKNWVSESIRDVCLLLELRLKPFNILLLSSIIFL